MQKDKKKAIGFNVNYSQTKQAKRKKVKGNKADVAPAVFEQIVVRVNFIEAKAFVPKKVEEARLRQAAALCTGRAAPAQVPGALQQHLAIS